MFICFKLFCQKDSCLKYGVHVSCTDTVLDIHWRKTNNHKETKTTYLLHLEISLKTHKLKQNLEIYKSLLYIRSYANKQNCPKYTEINVHIYQLCANSFTYKVNLGVFETEFSYKLIVWFGSKIWELHFYTKGYQCIYNI